MRQQKIKTTKQEHEQIAVLLRQGQNFFNAALNLLMSKYGIQGKKFKQLHALANDASYGQLKSNLDQIWFQEHGKRGNGEYSPYYQTDKLIENLSLE